MLNTDRQKSRSLTLPVATSRYTLTAAEPTSRKVPLNLTALRLGADDALPILASQATAIENVSFAPVSITFVAAPSAQNQNCR